MGLMREQISVSKGWLRKAFTDLLKGTEEMCSSFIIPFVLSTVFLFLLSVAKTFTL